jgi:Rrf2 family protein
MSKIVSLSEAASIGIHGMILISRSKVPMNVIRIAELTGSSRHHVAKVMQRLSKAGFIASLRGPSGGFSIVSNPGAVTFLDIYEAIEGKIQISECPNDKQICPFDKCIMNNVVSKMSEDFREYLAKQSISDY